MDSTNYLHTACFLRLARVLKEHHVRGAALPLPQCSHLADRADTSPPLPPDIAQSWSCLMELAGSWWTGAELHGSLGSCALRPGSCGSPWLRGLGTVTSPGTPTVAADGGGDDAGVVGFDAGGGTCCGASRLSCMLCRGRPRLLNCTASCAATRVPACKPAWVGQHRQQGPWSELLLLTELLLGCLDSRVQVSIT